MPQPQFAVDGSVRRRIHLFRHGDVSYVTEDGERVADPTAVSLTDWGHAQAAEMGEFTSHLKFDHAACSGLLRTVQTAGGILKGRGLDLQKIPGMQEIRSGDARQNEGVTLEDLAYSFAKAGEPGARYHGGEAFADFEDRVLQGLYSLLETPHWHSMALVLHGGVNRIILGWALGSGLASFAKFEQNTCCLNIIDVDTHPDTGAHVRTLVRGVNITAYNTARHEDHLTTLEVGVARMKKLQDGK